MIFSWHKFLLEHFSILLEHSSSLILSFDIFSLKLYCQVNERLLERSCVAPLEKKRRKSLGVGCVCVCVWVCVCGVCVCVCMCVRVGRETCITLNDSLTYFSSWTCITKNRTTISRRQQCAVLIFWTRSYFFFFFLLYAERFRLNVVVPLFDKTIWKRVNK